jgi:hypothetical protein
MAFMKLQSEFGRWYLVETRNGTEIVPADVVGDLGVEVGETVTPDTCKDQGDWAYLETKLGDYLNDGKRGIQSVELVEKWAARYSAPGYMDCTDWVLGATQEEAEEDCRNIYGDDEEEEEDDDEPTEPEEGDYVTSDYRTFYQYGKPVVVISPEDFDKNPDGWTTAVKAHMEASQFWPNVWLQGERGGYDLLSLETGGFA